MNLIRANFIELLSLGFVLLFILWAMGYVCNALLGSHFELESCWTGFQTLGGAGLLATVKYVVDSKFNSQMGDSPYDSILPDNVKFSLETSSKKSKIK